MKNKNKIKFGLTELLFFLITTLVFSFGGGLFLGVKFSVPSNLKITNKELNRFIENYYNIVDNYYGDVEEKELISGAIKGMVESLGDEYSNYFNKEESETFNIQLEGHYQGLGIEITKIEEEIIVIDVFKDSPAEKAGIKAGDIIMKINGEIITNLSSNELSAKIKSIIGEFEITVKREDKLYTMTVQKENIVISSVKGEIIEEDNKKIGYINVSLFAANTDKQFKEELEKLEKLNIDGLIIDVRWNSGGHLSTVEQMLNMFVDSSNVIYQMKNKEEVIKTFSKGKVTKDYPIVFLTNKESASASEMLVISLKENLNAKSVGLTTFGKGTVQEMSTISIDEQYKITTKNWLSPKGNSINKVGIKPDLEVELSVDYFMEPTKENDNQLQEALKMFK